MKTSVLGSIPERATSPRAAQLSAIQSGIRQPIIDQAGSDLYEAMKDWLRS